MNSVAKNETKQESTILSTFECSKGGKHEFDQLNYDNGLNDEFGHCIKCEHWISTHDGEDETLQFEEKRDMEKAEEDVYQISENIFAVEMGSPDNWGIVNGKERATNEDMDDEKVSPDEFASACEHEICLKINEKITELNGWLEISTSIYGSTQPTLNATFWYREDAVQFAYWYKKQW